MQGTASVSLWVPTKGRPVWMESDVASLGSAGLGLPLMPKYQRRGSREQGLGQRNVTVTKLRGAKGLQALATPCKREVKDQVGESKTATSSPLLGKDDHVTQPW